MAGKKFLSGHSAASFRLQFEDAERVLSAGNDDAGLVGAEDLPGFAG